MLGSVGPDGLVTVGTAPLLARALLWLGCLMWLGLGSVSAYAVRYRLLVPPMRVGVRRAPPGELGALMGSARAPPNRPNLIARARLEVGRCARRPVRFGLGRSVGSVLGVRFVRLRPAAGVLGVGRCAVVGLGCRSVVRSVGYSVGCSRSGEFPTPPNMRT